MLYSNELKQLADLLDQKGFAKQADIIDNCLRKIAQDAPALPPLPDQPADQASAPPPATPLSTSVLPTDDKESDTQEKISRTTFLMLQALREYFVRHLADFHYFGNDNIKTIQAAIDQLLTMYRVLFRQKSQKFSTSQLESYRAYISKLDKEAERSKKMLLSPAKVKIDKALFYDPISNMVNKIERLHDGGIVELQPVLKKARSVREAFGNIIERTSEQIAHMDLIETS